MELAIGVIFIGVPVLLMFVMVCYLANKIINTKQGITKADYPVVPLGGKMKRVHPNSFAAKQARKKGLIR